MNIGTILFFHDLNPDVQFQNPRRTPSGTPYDLSLSILIRPAILLMFVPLVNIIYTHYNCPHFIYQM